MSNKIKYIFTTIEFTNIKMKKIICLKLLKKIKILKQIDYL